MTIIYNYEAEEAQKYECNFGLAVAFYNNIKSGAEQLQDPNTDTATRVQIYQEFADISKGDLGAALNQTVLQSLVAPLKAAADEAFKQMPVYMPSISDNSSDWNDNGTRAVLLKDANGNPVSLYDLVNNPNGNYQWSCHFGNGDSDFIPSSYLPSNSGDNIKTSGSNQGCDDGSEQGDGSSCTIGDHNWGQHGLFGDADRNININLPNNGGVIHLDEHHESGVCDGNSKFDENFSASGSVVEGFALTKVNQGALDGLQKALQNIFGANA
jgi:hypothetical protein